MSILIKGMEMPEICSVNTCCLCTIGYQTEDGDYTQWCHRPKELGGGFVLVGTTREEEKPPKDCPLIEVPDGHGRLIDADILDKKFCSHCDDYMSGKDECKEGCFDLKIIKSIPTVIPADKDGET